MIPTACTAFTWNGTFNCLKKTLLVDDYALDYVVMHELAHLKIRNHGKQFIQILNKNMSDWEQRKAQLNETILEFNNA